MNKRIVLKTVIICLGIFIMLASFAAWYFFHYYEPDTEKKYRVLIACTDINPGDAINESMVTLKAIKESALSSHMITDINTAVGKKALNKVLTGDYISDYSLLPKENWYKNEDKIIVLPMDIEGRLANLIKKGSLIDVKVMLKDVRSTPKTVLSKITVEDILDENGISLGDPMGSKKAFAKVILNKEQRNKIYIASQLGKLIFELYCDSTQKAAAEEFQIPPEYLNNTPAIPPVQSSDKIISPAKGGEQ